MAGEGNRDWTNFDLFNAVKKICEEKGLSLYTQHRMVAQEILYELGEISIDSTESDEDKKLITSFTFFFLSYLKI